MLTLSADAIAEKNALASAGAWLELAEITLPGGATPILRLAANTQDVYWPGQNKLTYSNDLTAWGYVSPTVSYPKTSWDGTSRASEISMTGPASVYKIASGLTAGVTYRFRFWVKRVSGAATLEAVVSSTVTNKLVFPAADLQAGEWSTWDVLYTAPSSAAFVIFSAESDSGVWHVADCQVARADVLTPHAVTSGTAAVPTIYSAFPFLREDIDEAAKASTAALRVRVSNVDGTVQTYLESYAGLVGATVRLMLVHSAHLDLTTPEVDQSYEIMAASCDARWAYLDLGAASPMGKRFPRARILSNYCRWKFKGTECGYAGATATCDKTLAACRAMNGGSNSAAFGGFPGAGRGGLHA